MIDIQFTFIISQPRSGSTMLQRMLHQHSKITTVGEPWFLLPALENDFDLKINKRTKYNERFANEAIKEFKKNISTFEKQKTLCFVEFYKLICQNIVLQEGKSIFLDKTPRYYYIIDQIMEYFPNSKIIVLTRNPIDVLNSILNTWIGGRVSFLKKFQEDLFVAPKILAKAIKNPRVHHIMYEKLTSESNKELEKLCNYLEIESESEMLDISDSKKWKFGDPKMNIKKKIQLSSNKNWEQNISAQKWRFFNEYITSEDASYHEDLGYDLQKINFDLQKIRPNKIKLFFTVGFKFINTFFSRKILYTYSTQKVMVIRKLKNLL
jgi:hypothetical protein